MEKYIVDGKGFNVKPEDLQQFLIKYPNAQKYEEPGKTNDLSTTDTIVRPTRTVSRQITRSVSRLDRGSSEQQKVDQEDVARKKIYKDAPFALKGLMLFENVKRLIEDLVTDPEEVKETAEQIGKQVYNIPFRVANTFINRIPTYIRQGIKSIRYDDLYDGDELKYLKTLDPNASYVDPMGDPTGFKTNADRIKYLEGYSESAAGLAEKKANEFIVKKYKEINAFDKKYLKKTGDGIVVGLQEGDASDVIGGIFGATAQMIETVVPAYFTYGMSLPLQITAPMVLEYNQRKAEAIYGKDDPNALDKLFDNKQEDLAIPTTLGIIGSGFEYVGYKGVTNYMLGKAAKNTFAKLMLTGNKEGITELVQSGLDEVNLASAEGKTGLDLGKAFVDGTFSEKGLESYLQGFVGGTTMSAGSNAINRALRSDNASVKELNSLINDLAENTLARNKTKNKEVKEAIDLSIKQTEQKLKSFIQNKRNIANILNEDQRSSLINIINQKDDINSKIQRLNEQLKDGEVTNKEFGYAIRGLNNQNKALTEQIEVINESAKEQLLQTGLEAAKEQGEEIGLEQKLFNTKEEYAALFGEKGTKEYNEALEADGHISDDGNTYFVNMERAREAGAIGVGSHELLHGIIGKSFDKLSTEAKKKLNKNFLNLLSEKDKQTVLDRLASAYNITGEKVFTTEELYTAFSDVIIDGDVKFSEGVFGKIKNAFEEILRQLSSAGYFSEGNKFLYRKEFSNARQAYNFVKDYSLTIKKTGKVTERAKQFAKVDPGATQVKKSISAKAKKAQEAIDKIGRKAATKAEYDAGVNIEAYNYLIENKGLDGLIIAELNKRGIDTEAADANVNGVPLNDYMEDVRGKLIPDVLGFNPEAEVTKEGKFGLSGYINQRLKFRMGDVATKAKKTVVGKSIETPVGETGRTVAETIEDEGDTRLEAFEEQDLSVSAQNRAIETEQDKNELKSRYRHKLKNADGTKLITEERVENIREGIRSTLIKLADKAVSPDFLFNFEKIVKKDLKNIVQKAIGTKKQYFEFVSKNMADIVDFTSVQDLVALERLVGQGKLKGGKKIFTVAIRRLTKVEDIQKAINQGKLPVDAINKSKEGVMLYEKRMPTQEELSAFFFGENMQEVLGYKLGASTLGTRKDGLSRMIITELSQDGLMETIQEPDIAEEILSISEEAHIDVIVKNVATQVNRSPNLKFSKTVLDVYKESKPGTDTHRGAKILVKEGGYYSEAWKKFIEDKKVDQKVKLDLNKLFLQRKSENWYTVRKLVGAKALKGMGNIPTYKKFEKIARDVARKILNPQGYRVAHLTEVDNAPDLIIYEQSNPSVEIGIEIKGTTSRTSSKNLNSKPRVGFKRDKTTDDFFSDNAKKQVDKITDKMNKRVDAWFNNFGITKREYNKNNNLVITQEQYQIIKNKRLHLSTNFVEFITTKDVEVMYLNKKSKDGKKRPSQYINLGVSGLTQMGSENPLNIEGLERFGDQNVDIALIGRFDFGKPDVNGNRRVGIRIEGQLDSRFFKKQKANLFNIENPNIKIKKSITKDVSVANNLIKASRSDMSKAKGASIFDFDETVGISENFVIATKEGITKRIPSEQWPLVGETLKEQGYKFDFTDFNKVTKGRPGPLLQKMKNQIKKYGPKNVFILTARAPESQQAIHDWLKSEGVNIPIENVTGLGNSTAEAKAMWVLDKYANKGYNDIYFVDDALQNVQAVQNMFDQLDIKGKSVQAKVKFSKSMDEKFNDILEDVAGIKSEKRFSDVKARKRGANKGKFRFFIPPSHEDFVGLLYNFMGKGRQGDRHRNFFEEALIKPLNKAYRELNTARQSIANDYKSLNKEFKNVRKKLTKKTPDGDFTYQDAIRVYLWNKHAYNIPGLSDTDKAYLANLVLLDPELQAYAEQINIISKQDVYVNPTESWEVGDIRTDLDAATGRVGREQFFVKFFENADIIFSKENLNKIEAIYGAEIVGAIKDILYRTKTGRNRPSGQNKLVNEFLNYLNGSVAATMFFNIRSSVLQQMSIVNFINFADNNIYAAAKAFANQPQYWKDFTFLFNSDFMKQRRGGIMTDVDGAELAASVRGAVNPVRAAMKKLLQLGFLPTQIGDNIAIATGGATFYRNRLNTYLKEGFTQKEAQEKAFEDFQILAEATQQSARPDMVSQQQASALGRLILAFQNVTSQFNRLGKKAFLDLKNRRKTPGNPTQLQSDLSNISRMTYYFVIQNLIFYSLQSALFVAMFDDDEEDERFLKKKERAIQGSIDSVLRGAGVWGAVAATLKNMAIKYSEQRKKKYNKDESAVLMEMLNVSPPLGIKARKIVNAEKTLNYNREVIKEMELFDIDNPLWSAVTNYIESTTNFPANRLLNKTINIRDAFTAKVSAFFRALMFSGWSKWNLGIEDEKRKKIKEQIKRKKEQEKKTNTRRKIRRKIRR